MSTPTITEFLEARIAEDEADALADAAEMDRSSISIQFDCATQARFIPARVMAECAAKRAVIALWAAATEDGEDDRIDEIASGIIIALRDVIRALATVYANHADYRQEWAL